MRVTSIKELKDGHSLATVTKAHYLRKGSPGFGKQRDDGSFFCARRLSSRELLKLLEVLVVMDVIAAQEIQQGRATLCRLCPRPHAA